MNYNELQKMTCKIESSMRASESFFYYCNFLSVAVIIRFHLYPLCDMELTHTLAIVSMNANKT